MKKGYIEYQKGKLPIIFSSPHGGYLKPCHIKNRKWGNFNQDVFTQEITRQFHEHLYELTNFYPYFIINLLHRRKLDANRSLKAGTSDKQSKKNWKQYHDFINDAKKEILKNYGFCFFVDVHGFPANSKKVFIGYCLTNSNLKKSDKNLNKKKYINKSSVRKLYDSNDLVFSELIRGINSFGYFFENNDIFKKYKLIPSIKNKFSNGVFYGGGYNTKIHCVVEKEKVSGFQLEMSSKIRTQRTQNEIIKGEVERKNFSLIFCKSLIEYINFHYSCKF